jgi:hypothetical protein
VVPAAGSPTPVLALPDRWKYLQEQLEEQREEREKRWIKHLRIRC